MGKDNIKYLFHLPNGNFFCDGGTEPAKQSGNMMCIWIASQARNDVDPPVIARHEAIQNQVGVLCSWIASQARNDVDPLIIARHEAILNQVGVPCSWIASQARNDGDLGRDR